MWTLFLDTLREDVTIKLDSVILSWGSLINPDLFLDVLKNSIIFRAPSVEEGDFMKKVLWFRLPELLLVKASTQSSGLRNYLRHSLSSLDYNFVCIEGKRRNSQITIDTSLILDSLKLLDSQKVFHFSIDLIWNRSKA
jgi:hypothetical protein